MTKKHGFWYLLSGLGLGLGIGLWVAWVLAPLQFIDTSPSSLRVDFKDGYRFMIASAYAANNDLPRAQARLGTLADPDPLKALGEQAQRMLASDSPMEEVQILADLSALLQTQPTAVFNPTVENTSTASASPTGLASETPRKNTLPSPTKTATTFVSATHSVSPAPTTEETPTPQPKPIATIIPRATQTSSPTPGTPFELIRQSTFCEPALPGLLQINLSNADGKPAAGIELVITWASGEEHFFTGIKPELGYGYADFTMTENIEYALSLSAGDTRVTGLSAPNCLNPQGDAYPGGIHLEFKRP